MKLKNIIICCLFGLLIIAQASAQKEETVFLSLHQACRLAVDSNLLVKNAQLETVKTKYQAMESRSRFYPQLEGYSDFNYYYKIPKMVMPGEFFGGTSDIAIEMGTKYDWSSGFNASLTLFNLSYLTSLKVTNLAKKISTLSLLQTKEEIVYQLSQVYFLCIATKYQEFLLTKNQQNTARLLNILKAQKDNGLVRKIDCSKVLVARNNLQTEIDNISQLYKKQIKLLKYLTGISTWKSIELTDTFSAEIPLDSIMVLNHFNESVQPDFAALTELKVIDLQIEKTVLSKKGVSHSYYPTLSAFGTFLFQGQQDKFNFFDGENDRFFKVGYLALNLSIPIFDGFEKHASFLQYDVELQQLKNSRKNTLENFSKEYGNAVVQYKNSVQTLERQKENIRIAEEEYEIDLAGYGQQTVLFSELMSSENALREARYSLIGSWLQFKDAELELKKLRGTLLQF